MENQENVQNKSTKNQESSQIKNYVMMASLMLLLNLIILIVTLVIINSSSSSQIKSFQEFISQDKPDWVEKENKQILALDHALNELKEKISKLSSSNYNDNIFDLDKINSSLGIFVDELENNVPKQQAKKAQQLTEKFQKLQKELDNKQKELNNKQKELQQWQEPLENAKKQIALYSYTLEPIEKELSKLEQPRPKGSKPLTQKEKTNIKSRREQLNKWKIQLQREKEAIEYLYNKMLNCPDEINNKLLEQKESLETLLKEIDSYKNIQEKK